MAIRMASMASSAARARRKYISAASWHECRLLFGVNSCHGNMSALGRARKCGAAVNDVYLLRPIGISASSRQHNSASLALQRRPNRPSSSPAIAAAASHHRAARQLASAALWWPMRWRQRGNNNATIARSAAAPARRRGCRLAQRRPKRRAQNIAAMARRATRRMRKA